jgi:outer membrane protein
MKNLSYIINGVLAIAVAFLYYLHFSSRSTTPEVSGPKISVAQPSVVVPSNIVYVNSDSLLQRYEFFQKIKNDLEARKQRVESQLQQKARALEQEYVGVQQRLQSMSREEVAQAEQSLMGKQQEIMRQKDEQLKRLLEEEEKLNKKLFDNIYAYLKEYCKNTNYKYVLGYTRGSGGILYAKDSLDITPEVIQGLNKLYREGK